MSQLMEQFNKPLVSEFSKEMILGNPETQPASEREESLDSLAERLRNNGRGVKILTLMEMGYFPDQQEVEALNIQNLIKSLRQRYPVFDDVQGEMLETIRKNISVDRQEGQTEEQYMQAVSEKRKQYFREATEGVLNSLRIVYEKFGAIPSEENRTRIVENLAAAASEADSGNMPLSRAGYIKENLLAATRQGLTIDNARRIDQSLALILKYLRNRRVDERYINELEVIARKIREESGLAVEAVRENLEVPNESSQPERIELRKKRMEMEYPGMPVDVFLASKKLQIIDVRDDDRWRSPYLLIDPEVFDQADPKEGFKKINEGETFLLGRLNGFGFKMTEDVSRRHLMISLRNGKIDFEDLDSTNGTVLQYEKPKHLSRNQAESRETSSGKDQVIGKFREYIQKHQSDIEKELQQGRSLESIFYHDFYGSDIDSLKYNPNDPQFEDLKKNYDSGMETLKEDLFKKSVDDPSIFPMSNGYWLFCHLNGGVGKSENLGRIYLNLKPEFVKKFFLQATEKFKMAGLPGQMKVPLTGDAGTFNRLDKMVIYFDASKEQGVLQALEDLYRSNTQSFDETGIPRFTAGLKDKDGRDMSGVGFAEEPALKNVSFGQVRAKILAEVYNDAKYSHLSLSDPDFDFEASFHRACMKYQVDPQFPAFNLSGDAGKFSEIRKRIE